MTTNYIQRAPQDGDNPYFILRRDTAQSNLSYEAVGMLTYLLSKPCDWKVKVSDLQREGCGRDKVYRILDELAAAGYVTKPVKSKDAQNHWQWTPYLVREIPFPEIPYTENQEIKDRLENTEEKTSPPSGSGDRFLLYDKPAGPKEPPKPKAQDPIYNAIRDVWGIHNGANGKLRKMLLGVSTDKGYAEHNFDPPLESAQELLDWADWYYWYDLVVGTYVKRKAKKTISIVREHNKIQSSVYEFRRWKAMQAEVKSNGARWMTFEELEAINWVPCDPNQFEDECPADLRVM